MPLTSPPVQLEPDWVKVAVPLPPKTPDDSISRASCAAPLKFAVPPLMTRSPANAATSVTVRLPPDTTSVLPAAVFRLRIV